MRIELRNGAEIDVVLASVKRLTYQNIRGNMRYYVAIGNDNQAVEYEIPFGSYINLVGVLHGERRDKSESDAVLPSQKRSNRKAKADK